MQQRVVKRLTTIFGCLDKHFQILHNLLLATEVLETQWSQRVLEVLLASAVTLFPYVEILVHR